MSTRVAWAALLLAVAAGSCSLERGREGAEKEPESGAGSLVEGRVRDQDGRPVADHEVWLVDTTMGSMIRARPSYLCEEDLKERVARTRTDASGRYRFERVPAGKWYVGLAPVSGEPVSGAAGRGDVAPLSVRIRLLEEEARDGEGEAEEEGEEGEEEVRGEAGHDLEVDLRTHRGLELQGEVLLPDGEPAAACAVSAQIDRLFTFATVRTDSSGKFVITALAPGDVWLQASREGLLAESRPTLARAGDAGVLLSLEPAGAISGSIVDRETRQPVAATLTVTQRGGDRGCLQPAGAAAEFELGKLEPGVYDLAAISADGRVGVARGIAVKSDAHERGVAIEIGAGGKLTLKYGRKDAGAGFRLFSQAACLGWISLQAGQSITQTVPPGTIRVVELRAGGIDREVEVEAGREQTVLLEGK